MRAGVRVVRGAGGTAQSSRQLMPVGDPAGPGGLHDRGELGRDGLRCTGHPGEQQVEGDADGVQVAGTGIRARIGRDQAGEGEDGTAVGADPQPVAVVDAEGTAGARGVRQICHGVARGQRIRTGLRGTGQRGALGPVRDDDHHGTRVADLPDQRDRRRGRRRIGESGGRRHDLGGRPARLQRVDDGQGDQVTVGVVAGLPQSGGRRTTVVGEQPETTLQDRRTRYQARPADPAGGQRRQCTDEAGAHAGVVAEGHVGDPRGVAGGRGVLLQIGGGDRGPAEEPADEGELRQGRTDGEDLRQLRERQHDPGEDQEEHTGDQQADDVADGGGVADHEGGEQGVHPPGDDRRDDGRSQGPQCRLRHAAHAQVPQGPLEQPVADNRTGDETHAVRRTQQHHDEPRFTGDMRRKIGQHQLGHRDAADDECRRPHLFAGVEDTQVQQHQRVGDQRERGEADRPAEYVRGVRGVVTVGEEGGADDRAEGGEVDDHRHHRQHRQPRGHRQVLHHGLVVTVGGIARQARHERGEQGDADDAVGHLQQLPRLRVDRRGAAVRGGRDAVVEHEADLGDRHVDDDGQGHAAELLEPVIQPPQRAEVDPGLLQVRHHDQCLDDDPGGGAQTQQHDVRVGDGHVVRRGEFRVLRQQPVETQYRDGHDVVDDRGPGTGFEVPLRVEDRHHHREHRVEDDLRQHQIGEGRGHAHIDLAVGVQGHPGQQWRGEDGEDRHRDHQGEGQGDQASDERLTPVGVLLLRADQQRDDQTGEHRTEHQLGDEVRQGVGRVEGRTDLHTQRRADEHGTQEAGDTAQQRGEGHGAGRAHDIGVTRLPVRCTVGVSGDGRAGGSLRTPREGRLGRHRGVRLGGGTRDSTGRPGGRRFRGRRTPGRLRRPTGRTEPVSLPGGLLRVLVGISHVHHHSLLGGCLANRPRRVVASVAFSRRRRSARGRPRRCRPAASSDRGRTPA